MPQQWSATSPQRKTPPGEGGAAFRRQQNTAGTIRCAHLTYRVESTDDDCPDGDGLCAMNYHAHARDSMSARRRYVPPADVVTASLAAVLGDIGRPSLGADQMSFLNDQRSSDVTLYYAGNLALLSRPAVAIVGARDVSADGAARARKLSRAIASAGVTVVSGLAKGVDANAHAAAIGAGGATVAVIGTPLGQAYPAENFEMQEEIARDHLLISPFAPGSRVFPSNFPKRNRVMAALTDGSVIIEASDSSGTLHQAAECQRLGRWLFVLKSVFDDPALTWPRSFQQYEKMRVVASADDVLANVLA